jgi:hypothetical protein
MILPTPTNKNTDLSNNKISNSQQSIESPTINS